MPDQRRFYEVKVRREILTTVRVPASSGMEAVEEAMIRVPDVGRGWEVTRSRAEITNVGTVDLEQQH